MEHDPPLSDEAPRISTRVEAAQTRIEKALARLEAAAEKRNAAADGGQDKAGDELSAKLDEAEQEIAALKERNREVSDRLEKAIGRFKAILGG